MPCLPETIFGQSIDDVFAYPTVKFVKIRDRRLGLFKFLLTIVIALVIVLYQFWFQGLWYATTTVSGTVRFSLQQPTVVGPDGQPFFRVDAPHGAPSQHVFQYNTCMLVGAGIGVTPCASIMRSRWSTARSTPPIVCTRASTYSDGCHVSFLKFGAKCSR